MMCGGTCILIFEQKPDGLNAEILEVRKETDYNFFVE